MPATRQIVSLGFLAGLLAGIASAYAGEVVMPMTQRTGASSFTPRAEGG